MESSLWVDRVEEDGGEQSPDLKGKTWLMRFFPLLTHALSYLELLEDHGGVEDQVAHVDQSDPADEAQGDGSGQPISEMERFNHSLLLSSFLHSLGEPGHTIVPRREVSHSVAVLNSRELKLYLDDER